MTNYAFFPAQKFFSISTPASFDKKDLPCGDENDYVTRTTVNNGVNCKCGNISGVLPNSENTISLELMNMSFFYRPTRWYAGQFMRILTPVDMPLKKELGLYFVATLAPVSRKLKGLPVSKVNDCFNESRLYLPIDDSGDVDFAYMESFIKELECKYAEAIQEAILPKLIIKEAK